MRSSGVWRATRRPPTPDRLPPLLVLAGATATGKTRLSLELAEHLAAHGGAPAEIVSADSRQVYRHMDIGTAKVSASDRARVTHHGLDLVDPDEAFTAADFRRHALAALADIEARGRVAILVGGTGLYLRIIGRGVPLDESDHDPAVRAELEHRLTADGPDALVRELRVLAPGLADRTDLANPRRVVRALERARLTGDTLPPAPKGYPRPVTWLGVRLERAAHDRAIGERIRQQFRDGLLDEAALLRARYPEEPRAFSALGYREAFSVLDGRATHAAAVDEVAARTRRYARRQGTWFRSEPDIVWLPDDASRLSVAVKALERLLDRAHGPGRPDALS